MSEDKTVTEFQETDYLRKKCLYKNKTFGDFSATTRNQENDGKSKKSFVK